jgi:tetratricopeptide (TPR) repeat protein
MPRYLCCFVLIALAAPILAADADDADMPLLIRKASPAVQKAWRQVDAAVRDNEALKEPLPEPYLARAEVWAMVGNHEEALADQLRAVELLYKGKPSLLEQTRYLKRMQNTLARLRKMPRPYYPAEADKLYYLGRSLFFGCQLTEALKELNEAIRLRPDEPLYWYYRALTHKRLGKETEAVRDARVAASLRRAGKSKKDIPLELERIQGSIRIWLGESERWRPDDMGR